MDSLRGIVEFVTAADLGSFSAAARRLGVSVAHVSRVVAALERDLGVQLLVRTSRKSSLTEQGHDFYRRCRGILEALAEARDIARTAQAISGRIRMSMGGHYAETVLTPLLAEFMALHPGVSIELEMTSRNVRLIEENFDLAIRAGPLVPSSLIARRLIGFPLVTLAAPGLHAEGLSHPRDLAPANCLALGDRPWMFDRLGENVTIVPEGQVRTNSGTLLIRAAVGGLGVLQVPSYYRAGEVETAQLQRLLPEWPLGGELDFFLV